MLGIGTLKFLIPYILGGLLSYFTWITLCFECDYKYKYRDITIIFWSLTPLVNFIVVFLNIFMIIMEKLNIRWVLWLLEIDNKEVNNE